MSGTYPGTAGRNTPREELAATAADDARETLRQEIRALREAEKGSDLRQLVLAQGKVAYAGLRLVLAEET